VLAVVGQEGEARRCAIDPILINPTLIERAGFSRHSDIQTRIFKDGRYLT
jgi:hypothetical protein